MSNAAKAAKAALIADLPTAFAPSVQIAYGHPGTRLADEIVSVGNIESSRELGPMGTQRKLRETLTIAATISVWAGGVEAQQVVTERALDMLDALEVYLSDVGVADSSQLTLGGTVLRAWVVGFELTETDASMTDFDGVPLLNTGRLAEIAVSITATVKP